MKYQIELDTACKEILTRMIAKGMDVSPPAWVDKWTWEEKLYFFDNYGPYYLPNCILDPTDYTIHHPVRRRKV